MSRYLFLFMGVQVPGEGSWGGSPGRISNVCSLKSLQVIMTQVCDFPSTEHLMGNLMVCQVSVL